MIFILCWTSVCFRICHESTLANLCWRSIICCVFQVRWTRLCRTERVNLSVASQLLSTSWTTYSVPRPSTVPSYTVSLLVITVIRIIEGTTTTTTTITTTTIIIMTAIRFNKRGEKGIIILRQQKLQVCKSPLKSSTFDHKVLCSPGNT